MKININDLKEIFKKVEKNISKDRISQNGVMQIMNDVDENIMIKSSSENTEIMIDTGIKANKANENLQISKIEITKIKKLSNNVKIDFSNKTVSDENFSIKLKNDIKISYFNDNIIDLCETPLFLTDKIKEGIPHVIKVADKNNPRDELNGVLFNCLNNSLDIVSTDTRRLCITSDTCKSDDFEVIPNKIGLEFVDWLKVDYILRSKKHLIIKEGNTTHKIKCFIGKFLNYKRIISKDFNNVTTIKDAKKIFTDCKKFGTDISIIDKKIDILDNNLDYVANYKKSTLDIIDISINLKHLIDASVDDEVEFCTVSNKLPIVIKNKSFDSISVPITLLND